MKRNRSLNTTNGLLAKMESSYVTTCFGLHLWPSSGVQTAIPLHFYDTNLRCITCQKSEEVISYIV